MTEGEDWTVVNRLDTQTVTEVYPSPRGIDQEDTTPVPPGAVRTKEFFSDSTQWQIVVPHNEVRSGSGRNQTSVGIRTS